MEETITPETPLEFVNVDEGKDVPTVDETLTTTEKKTEEEKEAEEGDLDISDPDKTPIKYRKFVEENNKRIGEIAQKIVDEMIINSDIPYAFIEVLPQVLNGKIKVIKGRSKAFEEINKLSNKAHLTPIKDMDLYEYNQTTTDESEDMVSE